MKINDIAKEIAKREGKKSQVRMGDIKEILGILADMNYERCTKGPDAFCIIRNIFALGDQRAKKRNAKKRVKK